MEHPVRAVSLGQERSSLIVARAAVGPSTSLHGVERASTWISGCARCSKPMVAKPAHLTWLYKQSLCHAEKPAGSQAEEGFTGISGRSCTRKMHRSGADCPGLGRVSVPGLAALQQENAQAEKDADEDQEGPIGDGQPQQCPVDGGTVAGTAEDHRQGR